MDVGSCLKAFLAGKLVAIPTETVYGLAAPVDNAELLEKVFIFKERPSFNPLIVHVASIGMARFYARDWNDKAQLLAEHFWPGPLTIVVPKKESVPDITTAGLPTVGLRVPDHPLALEFIERLGVGLAAPSANKFMELSPTEAEHVEASFHPDQVAVLNGGPCRLGVESTVVSIEEEAVEILRPGMITIEDIQKKIGNIPVKKYKGDTIRAPGQLRRHYCPTYPLVTIVGDADRGRLEPVKARLGIEQLEQRQLNDNPNLAARSLYSLLREPPTEGDAVLLKVKTDISPHLWDCILDRLKRASALYLS